MTAVSQSYPNYLGGLNEQPDEMKKPGQVTEALNVIPDPVIGLTRRPGFENMPWKYYPDLALGTNEIGIEPEGTWFELSVSDQIDDDYLFIGCVNPDGRVTIFNQNGELQAVRWSEDAIPPHRDYVFTDTGVINVYDDDDELELSIQTTYADSVPGNGDGLYLNEYFVHEPEKPLKYCVSKDNIIFTNPNVVPTLAKGTVPTADEETKYYSFISLKALDLQNYNYTFRRYYPDTPDNTTTYEEIKDISIDKVTGLKKEEYEEDLTLYLQVNSPFRVIISGQGVTEDAEVDVYFTGTIYQKERKNEFVNKVEYSWTVDVIDPGKGFEEDETYPETISPGNNLPDITIKFRVDGTRQVTAIQNDLVTPSQSAHQTAEDILLDLAVEFEAVGIDKCVVCGNGLYLENASEFSIGTTEIAVADIINSQKLDDDVVPFGRVNTVAELPVECYPGFVVQVKNSYDGSGDYFLKFESESEVDITNYTLVKPDGFWEEIAKPHQSYNPNNSTLPHMITVCRLESSSEHVFVISPMQYEPRTAGTNIYNPSMFTEATPISGVNYYKNRLFFFTASGNVLTSQAGEINNLFISSALESSTIDPLDVVANSNQRVAIRSSAVVNNSMVLFGDSEQYNLTTDTSILSPDTVNITKISNYTFNRNTEPIYLGTNLGFISAGLTRFYEMTNVYDRGPIDINERSQQIQTQFGQGYNVPVSSREQSMVLIYKKYDTDNVSTVAGFEAQKSMYMYRFRQENSQTSSQTSWTKWSVDEPIVYVSMPRDKIFVVVQNGLSTRLYKMDSGSIEGLPANESTVLSTVPEYTDGYIRVGDDIVSGAPFETRITFPTIYARSKEGYDITSNLTIHRIKLSTAAIGAYNLEIKRQGYDPYTLLVEQTPANNSYVSSPPQIDIPNEFGVVTPTTLTIPPLTGEHIENVPVYTRNKNLTFTMKTDYNAPLTLRSMTWEGDWNQPYYRRG